MCRVLGLFASRDKKEVFRYSDNVRSAENVGSLFRTADAFATDKVFLCGISPAPASTAGRQENEELAKTALGAEKTVPWEYHKQTGRPIKKLKERGVCIAALEQVPRSVRLEAFRPRFPVALAVGHEVRGVSPSALRLADAIVEIPMHGQKEPLNVAVAFGIAAYEIHAFRTPS